MINIRKVKTYCCEDISKIENYDKAINDKEMWHCHHKLELIATGGVCDVDRQDLIDWGIYYNRPADEFIFLTRSEHRSLHKGPNKGKHFSEETRKKMLEAKKNISEETRKKLSEAHKGKHHSEETKRKMSETHKGKHLKLVDGKRVWY